MTCYLLAWVVFRDGRLVVAGAGMYSECGGSITHALQSTAPLELGRTTGVDFAEAEERMRDFVLEEIARNPATVWCRVAALALAPSARFDPCAPSER